MLNMVIMKQIEFPSRAKKLCQEQKENIMFRDITVWSFLTAFLRW